MKKKLLIIFIIFLALVGILYWYFYYRLPKISSPKILEGIEKKEKTYPTIELEKPPFIKD